MEKIFQDLYDIFFTRLLDYKNNGKKGIRVKLPVETEQQTYQKILLPRNICNPTG